MVTKIPEEGFADANLTIVATYGDDIRGVDGGGGHEG